MPDRSETDAFDRDWPDIVKPSPPLPRWLACRLLQADEEITWVRGPSFQPFWERYLTHPALFLVALASGAGSVGASRLVTGTWDELAMLAAGVVVMTSVFVLGVLNGYFTRLVVTNFRLLIVQGYEVCRSWDIDDLPRSLIHFGPLEDDQERRTVGTNVLKTMLGASSDQFASSKTILAFGKQLDRIKARKKR